MLPTAHAGPVVAAMLARPEVRKLSFTGSTRVGRLLLRSAADQVLSCSIELGGNAPFLVLADADVPAAVDGAMIATMRNGGEGCTAADRFFVHDAVADGFTATLAARVRMLAMGPAADPATELGPIITERPAATSTDSCGWPNVWRSAWSASTAESSLTPPRPSAG